MDNEPAESVVSFYEYCLLYSTELTSVIMQVNF